MKIRSHSALFLSTLAVVLAIVSVVSAQPGTYKPVEEIDAGVDLAAQSAVAAQSKKTNTKIALGSILKAEDNEPKLGARNFRLCLNVNPDKKPMTVQALVSMDQYSNFKLTSWVASACGKAKTTFPTFKPDTAYKAVAIDDLGANLAAQNAVLLQSEYTKTQITFSEMIKVEDKELKLGTRDFKLCMSVVNNGKPGRATALIGVDPYSNYKLTSWTDGKCGESADGFTTVLNSDAGIGLAADFAVKQHSKDSGVEHTIAGILKAENKGLWAMTYRICINVKEDGKEHVVQAVVSMDQYSNMKLVSWKHSKCGS